MDKYVENIRATKIFTENYGKCMKLEGKFYDCGT